MDYITSKQAADRWGITPNRVTILCKGGKISGAVQIGGQWMIPNGTEKPKDGRTKAAKSDTKEDAFRFPLFVNSDEDAFFPPLNEEERLLRKAELDFYACDFENAQKTFDRLSADSKNESIRIVALFYLCSLAVEVYSGENFIPYFAALQAEFSKEFPHKKDMEAVIPWLYTIMVQFQAVSSTMDFNSFYDYSPTVYPLMSYLSFYHLSNIEPSKKVDIHFDVYELLCRDFLKNGHYYEACELHFLLFLANYVSMREEEMLFHLRKGMSLVQKHKFYIIAASYEFYYPDAFDPVLKEFPKDFVKIIKQYSKIISNSLGVFAQKNHITEIFSIFSKSDYRYLIYASQGKTNKEVAHAIHVSERTVANHYNEIYNKLGINSKQELADMLNDMLSTK